MNQFVDMEEAFPGDVGSSVGFVGGRSEIDFTDAPSGRVLGDPSSHDPYPESPDYNETGEEMYDCGTTSDDSDGGHPGIPDDNHGDPYLVGGGVYY